MTDSSIAMVSAKSGVSVEWINTGEGEMRPGGTGNADLQTMRAVVEAVEEHLQAEGKKN